MRNVVALSPDEPANERLQSAMKVVNFVKSKKIKNGLAYYLYRDKNDDLTGSSGQYVYRYSINTKKLGIQNIATVNDLQEGFEVLSQTNGGKG